MAVESCADVLARLVADGPDIREAVVGVAHDLEIEEMASASISGVMRKET
jgi:hypothetical protein